MHCVKYLFLFVCFEEILTITHFSSQLFYEVGVIIFPISVEVNVVEGALGSGC